jgi:uncharacterized repeat protein (TIGR03803 family)
MAGLVDVKGLLYGTTSQGGRYREGTVFSIDPQGHEKVLHSFGKGKDGTDPVTSLRYVDGKFYGTTANGGTYGFGTVFSMTPQGLESVLYNFAGQPSDGASPWATLTYLDGAFYGTTYYGGPNQNVGTIFRMTLDGKETVLHEFGAGADGSTPNAQLVVVDGVLYGTTLFAGTAQASLFKISPNGKGYKVLHLFDYAGERANGLIYQGGNLYGITGGAPNEVGTFYTSTLSGKVATLYGFTGADDVSGPFGSIAFVHGAFYFAAANGGTGSTGGIVRITATGEERVFYDFGVAGSGDGAEPTSAPTLVGGYFYGTTRVGGAYTSSAYSQGGGAIYKIPAK